MDLDGGNAETCNEGKLVELTGQGSVAVPDVYMKMPCVRCDRQVGLMCRVYTEPLGRDSGFQVAGQVTLPMSYSLSENDVDHHNLLAHDDTEEDALQDPPEPQAHEEPKPEDPLEA